MRISDAVSSAIQEILEGNLVDHQIHLMLQNPHLILDGDDELPGAEWLEKIKTGEEEQQDSKKKKKKMSEG